METDLRGRGQLHGQTAPGCAAPLPRSPEHLWHPEPASPGPEWARGRAPGWAHATSSPRRPPPGRRGPRQPGGRRAAGSALSPRAGRCPRAHTPDPCSSWRRSAGSGLSPCTRRACGLGLSSSLQGAPHGCLHPPSAPSRPAGPVPSGIPRQLLTGCFPHPVTSCLRLTGDLRPATAASSAGAGRGVHRADSAGTSWVPGANPTVHVTCHPLLLWPARPPRRPASHWCRAARVTAGAVPVCGAPSPAPAAWRAEAPSSGQN